MTFWKSVRERDDVWDVLISIRQYDFSETPYDPDGEWVHSDVVLIITSAQPDDVVSWFPEHAVPEFAGDSWDDVGEKHSHVFVPTGMKPLFFWYD
ncbi:MAG: hypothetical protein HC869_16370 [Rhodospirillales bacterium]|nr:hypothetical protein [Rhodospirillales bacterium]